VTSSKPRPRTRKASGRPSLERFLILNDFVDLGLAKLPRSQIATYLVLFRDTRPTGLARTGLSDLARRGGMSRRQATRALRELIRRGAVHVIRPGVPGKATIYSIYSPDVLHRLNPTLSSWLQAPQGRKPRDQTVDTDVSNQGASTSTIPEGLRT
jgi:hypothetical protein